MVMVVVSEPGEEAELLRQRLAQQRSDVIFPRCYATTLTRSRSQLLLSRSCRRCIACLLVLPTVTDILSYTPSSLDLIHHRPYLPGYLLARLHLLHQYLPYIVLSTIHHVLRTTSHFLPALPPTAQNDKNPHRPRIKVVQLLIAYPIIFMTTILASFVDSPCHSRTFLDLLETTFLMPQMVLFNACVFEFAGFSFETFASSTRTISQPLLLGS
jgi:hypothetical protein